MIIGTCGFSWSGSSAVADLLAEYVNITVYNDDEFIIAFYPDGLEDLDFNLNTKCSKFLSSTVAIPRFRKVAKMLLKDITKGAYKRITDEYIEKLVQVKWLAVGQGQEVFSSKKYYDFANRFLRNLPVDFCRKIKFPPLEWLEYSIKPTNFYAITQDYTDSILKSIGLDLKKHIVLDQPFPGNNPIQCMNYYRNAKAIVVDRDPRDLYLLAKEYFPRRSYQTPNETVEEFITFFYHMHKDMSQIAMHPDVLCIKFEELVFEYEETVKKIELFLGLNKHQDPKKHFKPERSMANTRLFEKCTKYADDIKKIEEQLGEFLYDFDRFKEMKAAGGMFDENPPIDWRGTVVSNQ